MPLHHSSVVMCCLCWLMTDSLANSLMATLTTNDSSNEETATHSSNQTIGQRWSPQMIWSKLKKMSSILGTAPIDINSLPSSTSKVIVLNCSWCLDNFPSMGRQAFRSLVFEHDTMQFQLVIYPYGDNNAEYVSLYLEMVPNNIDQVTVFAKLTITKEDGLKFYGCKWQLLFRLYFNCGFFIFFWAQATNCRILLCEVDPLGVIVSL